MNDNLVMVRVLNTIPFEGIVLPVSKSIHIKKEKDSEFYHEMFSLLNSKGILKYIDFELDDSKRMELIKQNEKFICDNYMPYTTSYNSMSLWSINGIVPDDWKNDFSKKTCAILENLSDQLDKSDIVSLHPTDTAIRGNVILSKNATILIEKSRFANLLPEEQQKLRMLNSNSNIGVKIFDDNITDAIKRELILRGCNVETLSLDREDKGYTKSETSDKTIEEISSLALERKIPQVLHYNIIKQQNDYSDKFSWATKEVEYDDLLKDYYHQQFFQYLGSCLPDIDENVITMAIYYPQNEEIMSSLCSEINRVGLDKYKMVVDDYNKKIEYLKSIKTLPTPEQIIESINKKDFINLFEIIKKLDSSEPKLK